MKTFTFEQADEDFFAVLAAAAIEEDREVEIVGGQRTLYIKCTTPDVDDEGEPKKALVNLNKQ